MTSFSFVKNKTVFNTDRHLQNYNLSFPKINQE